MMIPSNEVAVRSTSVTVGVLTSLAHDALVMTPDGEMLSVSIADDEDLIVWSLVSQRLRSLARLIELNVHAELAERVRRTGGPVDTLIGKATETIARGSVSGALAAQIREVLEEAAADGLIPWEAVDNVAPLIPHVTPAKVHQYASDAPESLRGKLEGLVPEKRRTISVTERPV